MIIEDTNRTIMKLEIVTKQLQVHNMINKLKYGSNVHGYKLIKLS